MQLAKHSLAQQVAQYQRSLVESSAAAREELLAVLRVAADQAEVIQARHPLAHRAACACSPR
ncbi:MAG: hypothetical protein U1F25_13530 [Rubrivivax sp.]